MKNDLTKKLRALTISQQDALLVLAETDKSFLTSHRIAEKLKFGKGGRSLSVLPSLTKLIFEGESIVVSPAKMNSREGRYWGLNPKLNISGEVKGVLEEIFEELKNLQIVPAVREKNIERG